MEGAENKVIDHRAFTSKEETTFLAETVGMDKIIVEVGSYIGRTTCELAKGNIVIAIDPFVSGFDPRESHMMNMDGVEERFRVNIKGKSVIWFKEKSEEVLSHWVMPIDGVFIDGKHSTKALTIDLGWVEHVKPGGILAFHDYGFSPEVTDVIDAEIKPKYEEIGRVRFLIIFRKK